MGVNIAPEIHQKKMQALLGIEDVIVYTDDVVVFGTSSAKYDATLTEVLDRIRKSGLKLNRDKCLFKKEQIEFLGHMVSNCGISPSPGKVDAILRLEAPKDVIQLRKVHGMLNFLTKFVPITQIILSPLNELLRKDVQWIWNEPQRSSFEQIKKS
jgi:hypothetical protein